LETIAVYWEARVKVYSLTEKPGLAMGVLFFPTQRTGYWSGRLMELEASLNRFELVTCHGAEEGRMQLSVVIEASGRDTLLKLMDDWLQGEPSAQFMIEEQVDLVFLHGPHFQDRFGIADTAFSALAKNNIRIMLSGCAGTSMYLVFAGDEGSTAMKILTDTFLIPTVA